MSPKLKGLFNKKSTLHPTQALLAAAALSLSTGCAKLAFELPGHDEVRKIQDAGVEAPPPSESAPVLISTSADSSQTQPSSTDTPASSDSSEGTTPSGTPSSAPSETPSSSPSDSPSAEPSSLPSDSPSGTPSPAASSSASRESDEHDNESEHASESGQEHSNEHSAHHRSHAKASHAYSRTFSARKLTDSEIRRALTSLPYRATSEHPMETLQMSRATKGRTTPRPHVINSQVIFGIDITDLPGGESLTHVGELRLSMEVTRVSIKNQQETEILCLVELGRCSGRAIAARSWQANRNESFWSAANAGGVIHSSTFADTEPGTQIPFTKNHRLSEGRIDINLNEALGDDTLSAIRGITTDEKGRRILLVSVSDDTLVHSADLVISGTEKIDLEIDDQELSER